MASIEYLDSLEAALDGASQALDRYWEHKIKLDLEWALHQYQREIMEVFSPYLNAGIPCEVSCGFMESGESTRAMSLLLEHQFGIGECQGFMLAQSKTPFNDVKTSSSALKNSALTPAIAGGNIVAYKIADALVLGRRLAYNNKRQEAAKALDLIRDLR